MATPIHSVYLQGVVDYIGEATSNVSCSFVRNQSQVPHSDGGRGQVRTLSQPSLSQALVGLPDYNMTMASRAYTQEES